jgi:hypothetical protein
MLLFRFLLSKKVWNYLEAARTQIIDLLCVVVWWLVGVLCGRGKVDRKVTSTPPPTITYPLGLPKQPRPHTSCKIRDTAYLFILTASIPEDLVGPFEDGYVWELRRLIMLNCGYHSPNFWRLEQSSLPSTFDNGSFPY